MDLWIDGRTDGWMHGRLAMFSPIVCPNGLEFAVQAINAPAKHQLARPGTPIASQFAAEMTSWPKRKSARDSSNMRPVFQDL